MKNNQKIEPHILQKYTVLKKLGSGAYGHVWKVQSKQNKQIYALKKIFDAFQHSIDAQRTFRQVSVLNKLKHPKIIGLEEVIPADNNEDIYLVFEYMESDLYHLIYEGKLQPIHVKYILYQLLVGLNYLHHSNLIHRDLKPSNLLINSDCSIKICDFGLVRYLGQQANDNILTEGVATRWYRAPQILLGSNNYDSKADIWSTGCIIGEILLKNPLFPGNCTANQLQRILRLTGEPSHLDMASIQAQLTEVMISQVGGGKIKKIDYFSKIEQQNKQAVDLLYKMLEFNPTKRPSAQQALRHPYFSDFFNENDILVKKQPIFMQVDENIRLEKQQYLEIIKEKFTKENKKASESLTRPKISNSPKRFCDLRRSRRSSRSTKKPQNQSKQNKENKSFSKNCTLKRDNSTNLFKELCQKNESTQKIKNQSSKKNLIQKTSLDKENRSNDKNKTISHCENKNVKTKIQASFTNLRKVEEKAPRASFTGLRKVSKLQK